MTRETTDPSLSRRLSLIQPSPSIAANALAARLRGEGRDIVNLTIGEPDLGTPAHIVQAAKAALERGDTHYTPTAGTAEIRKAIVHKLARDNDLAYDVDEVVAGCGGKHIIYHVLAATLDPGDEVLIGTPYWVSYPDMARLNDGIPVFVPGDPENGFKIRPEGLAAAITERSKWLILNSPNNPTGAVYSRSELAGLLEVVRQHPRLQLLSDEIYEHFVFDGLEHVSPAEVAPDLRDRIFIVNGVSKSYAMTGWRLGFGAGRAALVTAVCTLLSQSTTCPSSISQAAAAAALAGDQSSVEEMREIYAERKRLVLDSLASIEGLRCTIPQGAFYVYVDISGLLGKAAPDGRVMAAEEDVISFLLQDAGVAVIGGAAYGLSPYMRLSFAAAPEAIREGCRRIVWACAQLK